MISWMDCPFLAHVGESQGVPSHLLNGVEVHFGLSSFSFLNGLLSWMKFGLIVISFLIDCGNVNLDLDVDCIVSSCLFVVVVSGHESGCWLLSAENLGGVTSKCGTDGKRDGVTSLGILGLGAGLDGDLVFSQSNPCGLYLVFS